MRFALASPKDSSGKLKVTIVDADTKETVLEDTYDTVLYATGRKADTANIGLDVVGVKVRNVTKVAIGPPKRYSGTWPCDVPYSGSADESVSK